MSLINTPEWVALTPQTSIVIQTNGRFSIYRARALEFGSIFQDSRLAEPGTSTGTRLLLSGALAAGLQRTAQPDVNLATSLLQVIYRLCGRYQTTYATPRVFQHVAITFRGRGLSSLADFIEQKVMEETGHDQLVLKDLTALGLPAEQLVHAIRPATGVALVNYLQQLAEMAHPVGILGYAYALERAALFVNQHHIDATQALCPPGVNATRGMRVHSAVGSDSGHVAALVDFVATLSAEERISIAQAIYQTGRIMSAAYPDEPPSDATIAQKLRQLGILWPLAACN